MHVSLSVGSWVRSGLAAILTLLAGVRSAGRSIRERHKGDDGAAGALVGVPSGPPPGLSERGPRRRGPRGVAEAKPENGVL